MAVAKVYKCFHHLSEGNRYAPDLDTYDKVSNYINTYPSDFKLSIFSRAGAWYQIDETGTISILDSTRVAQLEQNIDYQSSLRTLPDHFFVSLVFDS